MFRTPPSRFVPLVLLVWAAAALFLRSLPADQVFLPDDVRFAGADPWFHVRLIENAVHNFPHPLRFDPFAVAPNGQWVPVAPFFDLLVAGVALVLGFGDPSPRLVHVVAAWTPAVMGALLVVPVYLLGRLAWDRTIGLVAAGLVAILPGVFLRRTLVGYPDHHAAEVLFAVTALVCLAAGLRRAGDGRPEMSPLRRVAWSLLFGLALAAYLGTWIGGSLLVFVILSWWVVQAVVDRGHGRDSGAAFLATAPGLALAWVVFLPGLGRSPWIAYHVAGLTIALALVCGLALLARVAARRSWSWLALAGSVVAGAVVSAALFRLAAPELFASSEGMVRRFLVPGAGTSVSEVRGLLATSRHGPFRALWGQFTTGALLAPLGIALAVRPAVAAGDRRRILVLVVAVFAMLATLVQVRFAYYSAVAVALATALVCQAAYRWAADDGPRPAGGKGFAQGAVAAFAVFLLAAYPNVVEARRTAIEPGGPDADWLATLDWLREETPDPLPPGAWTEQWVPAAGERYPYPADFWSVMNWWDYGWWIEARARRVPVSNPAQSGAAAAATFYLAQSEAHAAPLLDAVAARYVLVDRSLPVFTPTGRGTLVGKFRALAAWAGQEPSEFLETYWTRAAPGAPARPQTLLYPAYFRTMLVRLYLYEGGRVPPPPVVRVVSWEWESGPGGDPVKTIAGFREFPSYDEARAWVVAAGAGNHRIVSADPRESPVALEALERFRLVYGSPGTAASAGERRIATVEVFLYEPSDDPT